MNQTQNLGPWPPLCKSCDKRGKKKETDSMCKSFPNRNPEEQCSVILCASGLSSQRRYPPHITSSWVEPEKSPNGLIGSRFFSLRLTLVFSTRPAPTAVMVYCMGVSGGFLRAWNKVLCFDNKHGGKAKATSRGSWWMLICTEEAINVLEPTEIQFVKWIEPQPLIRVVTQHCPLVEARGVTAPRLDQETILTDDGWLGLSVHRGKKINKSCFLVLKPKSD